MRAEGRRCVVYIRNASQPRKLLSRLYLTGERRRDLPAIASVAPARAVLSPSLYRPGFSTFMLLVLLTTGFTLILRMYSYDLLFI